MDQLLKEIKGYAVCAPHLINGVNPVMAAHKARKIAIIGQAPGSIVHRTGIPWEDNCYARHKRQLRWPRPKMLLIYLITKPRRKSRVIEPEGDIPSLILRRATYI